MYVGGGCLDASRELREFVDRTNIPVAQTLMGLGTFPEEDDRCLQVRAAYVTAALHCMQKHIVGRSLNRFVVGVN